MNNTTETQMVIETLKQYKLFEDLNGKDLSILARESKATTIEQGQIILRPDVIETHAFLVVKGSVRLLTKNPINQELYTVGTADAGDIIGVIDVLRQAPCEIALAKQKSELIRIPHKAIFEIYNSNSIFQKTITN